MSAKIDFAVVIHSGVAQVTFSIALDNNAFATIFVENILERERSEIKKRRKKQSHYPLLLRSVSICTLLEYDECKIFMKKQAFEGRL